MFLSFVTHRAVGWEGAASSDGHWWLVIRWVWPPHMPRICQRKNICNKLTIFSGRKMEPGYILIFEGAGRQTSTIRVPPLGYNTSNELCLSVSIFHFEGPLPLVVVNHRGVGPGLCFINNFLWYFFNQPLSRVWPPCMPHIASWTFLMMIS